MKVNLIVLALALAVSSALGQTKVFEYKGVDNSYPSPSIKSTRTYLTDSTFTDSGLLCNSAEEKECSITFKKRGKDWFVKANGEWQELYANEDSLIKVVYFKNEKFILKPTPDVNIFNGRELRGFTKEVLYVNTSHFTTYWFDPEFGIVIIEGENSFIRQDYLKGKKNNH
ncbi:hypothetical protein [Rufibacter roseus]|uniref:Beta-lactamase-inhibitor-like PepSY-like domain-containing protein n=1 Tax=Rufibacter roseus TaxID=1567108 RepID=A0ABW2DNV5_9BACT|nr:hypothetical protein [Rufibacter roseus]